MATGRWKQWMALATVLAVIVSGCSSGNKSTDPSGGTSESNKVVQLKFWGAVPPENGPQSVVDRWNAEHPNIQVEYVRYLNDDSGNTKLDTALISKHDAPDIFVSYGETHLNRRINAGMAEPLDDLIVKSGFDLEGVIGKDNIIPYHNQTMYLPAIRLLSAVLFNENILKEKSMSLPTDWTLEEFVEVAAQLTTPEHKGTFMGVTSDNLPRFALIGSKPVDSYYKDDGTSNFDSEALRRGLELQKRLFDEKSMVSWSEVIANKMSAQNELLTGKAAMIVGGTHFIRDLKNVKDFPRDFKVVFAPIPQYQKGGNVNYAGFNDFISINKNSAYKEEAMQFIAWYLTEGNEGMVPGGRLPSNKNADMDKIVDLFVGEFGDQIDKPSLAAVLKKEYTFQKQLNSTAFSDLSQILLEETEKYVMGVQSLDKTMEQLKARADQVIAEAK